MAQKQNQPPVQRKLKDLDFEDALSSIDAGAFLGDAETVFKRVVKAVRETGKKGALTIKLDIAPMKAGRQIELGGKITEKVPKHPRPAAILYTNEEGGVHRSDPEQHALFEDEDAPKLSSVHLGRTGTDD